MTEYLKVLAYVSGHGKVKEVTGKDPVTYSKVFWETPTGYRYVIAITEGPTVSVYDAWATRFDKAGTIFVPEKREDYPNYKVALMTTVLLANCDRSALIDRKMSPFAWGFTFKASKVWHHKLNLMNGKTDDDLCEES